MVYVKYIGINTSTWRQKLLITQPWDNLEKLCTIKLKANILTIGHYAMMRNTAINNYHQNRQLFSSSRKAKDVVGCKDLLSNECVDELSIDGWMYLHLRIIIPHQVLC